MNSPSRRFKKMPDVKVTREKKCLSKPSPQKVLKRSKNYTKCCSQNVAEKEPKTHIFARRLDNGPKNKRSKRHRNFCQIDQKYFFC